MCCSLHHSHLVDIGNWFVQWRLIKKIWSIFSYYYPTSIGKNYSLFVQCEFIEKYDLPFYGVLVSVFSIRFVVSWGCNGIILFFMTELINILRIVSSRRKIIVFFTMFACLPNIFFFIISSIIVIDWAVGKLIR